MKVCCEAECRALNFYPEPTKDDALRAPHWQTVRRLQRMNSRAWPRNDANAIGATDRLDAEQNASVYCPVGDEGGRHMPSP